MNAGIIAFIVIYCVVLCCYFVTETSGKMKLRAPNKILLALMFTVFAIVSFCVTEYYRYDSYHVLLLVAIILAALGDVFLLFSLGRGLDFFLAGNIAFITYETVVLVQNGITIDKFWWVYLVAGIMALTLGFSFFKFPNFFKTGKMRGPAIFYASSIFTHGITGVAVMAYCPGFLLLGIGSFLFMCSDIVITFNKFVCPENKWVLRLNSALYFTGLLLIVLSMVIRI